jgi:hypothetical protein
LAVASFCLITLMALLPVGMEGYQQADQQGTMVNLATMVVRDLQATPASGTSPRFAIAIPTAGTSASSNPQIVYTDTSGNVVTGTSRIYRISVSFTAPTASTNRAATTARILITWPALADAGSTSWPVEYSNMFETSIALNRN